MLIIIRFESVRTSDVPSPLRGRGGMMHRIFSGGRALPRGEIRVSLLRGGTASRVSALDVQYTANEGPMRIQYKCLVPIDVFPEIKLTFPKHNYNALSPSSYTHISVRDLYTVFPGSVCLFCCRKICRPILGIYKSLTDT